MLHIDALSIAGLLAAAVVFAFLVRTCMVHGCSKDCG